MNVSPITPLTKKRLLGLLGLGLCLLGIGLVMAYYSGIAKESSAIIPLLHRGELLIVPVDSPLRTVIKTQAVAMRPVASTFVLPAVVMADPAKLMQIMPPLTGRVSAIYKQLGDKVQIGESLLSINSSALAQVISDVSRAKSALLLATQNLERQKKLVAARIAARHDTEQAQNDYEQAVSELARARARLSELHIKNTAKMAADTLTMHAPLTGTVTAINTSVGTYLNDLASPVMTVADLSQVYVNASAQEKDLKNLFVGQEVHVLFDAYPQPISAKVHYISAILNPDTRTVNVAMILDNSAGLYKPNMFAKARFSTQVNNRIILPLTAVIQRGFDSMVFVEVKPWVFEIRRIQVNTQTRHQIEVISGLKEHEKVVVAGGIVLND